jgi:hypothetical protein
MFAQMLNKRTKTFPARNVPTDVVTRNETSTFLNVESELFIVTPRATRLLQSQQFPTKAGGGVVCLGQQGQMYHVLRPRGNIRSMFCGPFERLAKEGSRCEQIISYNAG